MKILRAKDNTLYIWDLREFLSKHSIVGGERFGISWKIGKRRKLRSYRLVSHSGWECDCCGWVDHFHLTQGKSNILIDNHLGQSYFGIRG